MPFGFIISDGHIRAKGMIHLRKALHNIFLLLSPLVRLVSDRNPFHTASLDVQEVERVETDHMKEVKGRKNLM